MPTESPLARLALTTKTLGHPARLRILAMLRHARLSVCQIASVLDVAPLLFHLAGAPVPDDLEGELREELLEPRWLAAHPVVRAPASALPGLPAATAATEPDPALVETLRALGYVR